MIKNMNYKESFEILNIDLNEVSYSEITIELLKKKYHKIALQIHPDKNGNTLESNEKFKKLNEAYEYLKREIKILNPTVEVEIEKEDKEYIYSDILHLFLKTILEGKYNEIILNLIKDIVCGFTDISIKILEDLDKETSLYIYTFLSKYRLILHLNNDKLEQIRNIVLKKYEHIQMYKLNPSINDLLNNNVYKLYVEEQLYLVPLWYNELYFECRENKGTEIIVICDPELESNITIDDNNNIYFEKVMEINEFYEIVFQNLPIKINIGNKEISVPISELYMKKEQYYRVKNVGLSKIKDDIYDVSEKADIIIKIILTK
jgi:hypothetical protein